MQSIPDPASPAAVFSKPSSGEPNPRPVAPDDDLVRRAVLQLRAFAGTLDRAKAERILPDWRNFAVLTREQLGAIIESFPASEDEDDEPRIHRGGGWLSGPSQGGSE